MRQDSMVLAAHHDLAHSALDISDGVLPNDNDNGANEVFDIMLEFLFFPMVMTVSVMRRDICLHKQGEIFTYLLPEFCAC